MDIVFSVFLFQALKCVASIGHIAWSMLEGTGVRSQSFSIMFMCYEAYNCLKEGKIKLMA